MSLADYIRETQSRRDEKANAQTAESSDQTVDDGDDDHHDGNDPAGFGCV